MSDNKAAVKKLVQTATWDYSQKAIKFVCDKLDALPETKSEEEVGRRKAWIDMLDYLEQNPTLDADYDVELISEVKVSRKTLYPPHGSTSDASYPGHYTKA